MFRLVLGLLKGAVIGGAIGYGAFAAGMDGGFNWVTYGLIGACVGLLVGRPIWSHLFDKRSTVWVAVLKAGFGFAVACGLYAVVAKAWGSFDLTIADETRRAHDWQYVFGGIFGALYGAFVEADDAAPKEEPPKKAARG
ncbi:MAG TPA: hypothetical protein VML75_19010 [Kofleriaceae bacterium]|nr:hypothetical protein [Kofleriaceae bacterium]